MTIQMEVYVAKKKKNWLLATLVFSINYLMVETILTQYLKIKDQIDIPPVHHTPLVLWSFHKYKNLWSVGGKAEV